MHTYTFKYIMPILAKNAAWPSKTELVNSGLDQISSIHKTRACPVRAVVAETDRQLRCASSNTM